MTENATKKQKYKIVIVGAGAAGLGAANHLIKNGIEDFLILEGKVYGFFPKKCLLSINFELKIHCLFGLLEVIHYQFPIIEFYHSKR